MYASPRGLNCVVETSSVQGILGRFHSYNINNQVVKSYAVHVSYERLTYFRPTLSHSAWLIHLSPQSDFPIFKTWFTPSLQSQAQTQTTANFHRITKPGASPPSACFTIQSYPKPTLPSEKWILVRVYAAGLNRAELRGRNNDRPGIPEFGPFVDEFHIDPPAILGEEFVGTVEVAGKETNFKVGDKVSAWVYGGGKAHDGTYAEYTLCLAERAVKFESTLPWDVLGGIAMSMWTAYGSLFDSAETKPGSVVVVHGGTSSVGIWAILLAKDKSCTVIATTRQPGKLEKLKATGADYALLDDDSLVANVRALYPKGVNTVLELVGPDKLEKIAFPMLARHGACVVSGILTKVWALNDFTPAMIPPTRKLCFFTSTSNEDIEGAEAVLQDVIRKVESGVFKKEVYLDKVFKLEDVGKAHEYMEENRAIGKVVVTID